MCLCCAEFSSCPLYLAIVITVKVHLPLVSLFDPLGFITRFTHGVGRLLLHKREAGKILISPKCCRKVAIITHSRKRQQGERSLVKYD